MLNPGGSVTIRDFVQVLYRLLNTDEKGSGRFVDIPENDACYHAAAYLKDLGILSGKRLHPDDRLTRGEMLKTLSAFYPQTEETFVFQDLGADNPLYPYFCTAAANDVKLGSRWNVALDKHIHQLQGIHPYTRRVVLVTQLR